MFCTDGLLEGVSKASCPQDILRGFTGKIGIAKWEYNNQLPFPEAYWEADKYSIKIKSKPELGDGEITKYHHSASFALTNVTNETLVAIANMSNMPLVLYFEKEGGDYIQLTPTEASRVMPSIAYGGVKSPDKIIVEASPYHKMAWEKSPPLNIESNDMPISPYTHMSITVHNDGDTFTSPFIGTKDIVINWGDNIEEHFTGSACPSHTYALAGDYILTALGSTFTFRPETNSIVDITRIDNFGKLGYMTASVWGQQKLKFVDMGTLDMERLRYLDQFANSCYELEEIRTTNFQIPELTTNLSEFAKRCYNLRIFDVTHFDMKNIEVASEFAADCQSLESLNTSNWDTRSLINVTQAFENCSKLTSSFDEYRWWNRTDDLTSTGNLIPIPNHTDTFKGSVLIPEYLDIPNDWKGL